MYYEMYTLAVNGDAGSKLELVLRDLEVLMDSSYRT
jgi:hypothetical protein